MKCNFHRMMINATYYYQPYDDNTISAVQLTDDLLNDTTVTTFAVAHQQQVHVLN